LPFVSFHLGGRAHLPLLPSTITTFVLLTLITSPLTANRSPTHRPGSTSMTRYIVEVIAGDRTASLVVVLSSSQPCSALIDAVKARLASIASKLNLSVSDNLTITLHLEEHDGPILDPGDLLHEVLPYTNEICCAVIEVNLNNPDFASSEDSMETDSSLSISQSYQMNR
jgi:hypothetical protein